MHFIPFSQDHGSSIGFDFSESATVRETLFRIGIVSFSFTFDHETDFVFILQSDGEGKGYRVFPLRLYIRVYSITVVPSEPGLSQTRSNNV